MQDHLNKPLYEIYLKFCTSNGILPKPILEDWRKDWREEYKAKLAALQGIGV